MLPQSPARHGPAIVGEEGSAAGRATELGTCLIRIASPLTLLELLNIGTYCRSRFSPPIPALMRFPGASPSLLVTTSYGWGKPPDVHWRRWLRPTTLNAVSMSEVAGRPLPFTLLATVCTGGNAQVLHSINQPQNPVQPDCKFTSESWWCCDLLRTTGRLRASKPATAP